MSPTFLAYFSETTAGAPEREVREEARVRGGQLDDDADADGAATFKPFGYCQLTIAFGALARLNENATSWAVICDPSQNLAFGSRLNVNVLPSLLIFQVFAMYGWKPLPSGVAMIRLPLVWNPAQRLSFSLM